MSSSTSTAALGQKRERSEDGRDSELLLGAPAPKVEADDDDDQAIVPPPSSHNAHSTTRPLPSPPRPAGVSTTTTTRLVIRDIVVDNFKSYAGVHTIGPFHKTFTATIGPNGSGKSNVIDAMLFVFGKNAKKIRLEKLSELIHNSAAFPNLNHASVQVNFVLVRENEEDKKDPTQRLEVPGSEFSVSREVYRTNQSQYFVNGRKSTQRDVVELLTSHGIDLDHNRFLILQGEVEQIALMKPKAEKEGEEGLVEYFDDLIGSNKFALTIKEAARIAEENQSQRLDQLDALKRVQGERDALSGAKDSTYGYIRKRTHLQRIITVMCQLTLRQKEAELAEPRAKVAAITGEIDHIHEQVEGRIAEQQSLIAQHSVEKKCVDAARREHEELVAERQIAEQELERAKAGAEDHNKQLKRLQDRLRKCQGEARDLETNINTATSDIAIASQNLTAAQEELARLQPVYELRTDELHNEMKPLRQKQVALKEQVAPYVRAVTTAKQKLEDAQFRIDAAETDLKKRLEELQSLQEERTRTAQTIANLAEAVRSSESSGSESEARINELSKTLGVVTAQKYAIDTQISGIKQEHRNQQNGDRVMTLLSSQGLPKYYGTLRQLGRIEDMYDVAAGVASSFWGNHVVQDHETARQVIQILKSNDMRASLIVLDEVDKTNKESTAKVFECPPGSQRIYDLIKPTSPKFAAAFYMAVRDTLVVENFKVASSYPKNRFRVVTLNGGLHERNGVLTGGGEIPRGANLKASHSPADQKQTRQRLEVLQAELNEVLTRETAIQEELMGLNRSRVSYNPADIRRLKMTLANSEATLSITERRIHDAEERVKASQDEHKELPSLKRAERAAATELEKAEKELLQHSAALNDVERALENVGGEEYKTMGESIARNQEVVDNQKKRLEEAKKQRQRALVTKESKEKDVSKIEAEIERHRLESEQSTKDQITALSDAGELLSRRCGSALANVKRAESKLHEVEERLAEVKRDLSRLESKRSDLDRSKREQESQMSDQLKHIASLEDRIAQARLEIVQFAKDFGASVLKSPEASNIGGDIFRRSSQPVITGVKRERDGDGDEDGSGSEDALEDANQNHLQRGSAAVDDEGLEEDEDEFDEEAFSLTVAPEELDSYSLDQCSAIGKELKVECDRLKQTIDFQAVKSWRDKQKEYLAAKEKYDEIVARVANAEQKLEEVTIQRKELFMASFKIIQRKLKEMYQLLAHGGDADVDLVDSSDPYEGVNFTVRPPKKSWKQVSNLSGGEKTLSSLALVFALHHIRPTPIYVMDEIDAALDFRNVSIVAMYVLEQAQGAQFLIISLRNNMFELAHQLVGINKVNDVTRSLTLNPGMLAKLIERRLKEAKEAKQQLSQRQHQHAFSQ